MAMVFFCLSEVRGMVFTCTPLPSKAYILGHFLDRAELMAKLANWVVRDLRSLMASSSFSGWAKAAVEAAAGTEHW